MKVKPKCFTNGYKLTSPEVVLCLRSPSDEFSL